MCCVERYVLLEKGVGERVKIGVQGSKRQLACAFKHQWKAIIMRLPDTNLGVEPGRNYGI